MTMIPRSVSSLCTKHWLALRARVRACALVPSLVGEKLAPCSDIHLRKLAQGPVHVLDIGMWFTVHEECLWSTVYCFVS